MKGEGRGGDCGVGWRIGCSKRCLDGQGGDEEEGDRLRKTRR